MMAWCTDFLPKLTAGETIQCRPRGNSMNPKIKSGDLCTIRPYKKNEALKNGMIVLAKVRGSYYLHLISAQREGQVQISNNHGYVNGWTSLDNVFGVLIARE